MATIPPFFPHNPFVIGYKELVPKVLQVTFDNPPLGILVVQQLQPRANELHILKQYNDILYAGILEGNVKPK